MSKAAAPLKKTFKKLVEIRPDPLGHFQSKLEAWLTFCFRGFILGWGQIHKVALLFPVSLIILCSRRLPPKGALLVSEAHDSESISATEGTEGDPQLWGLSPELDKCLTTPWNSIDTK